MRSFHGIRAQALTVGLLTALTPALYADDVRADDLIISGNACIGTDCVVDGSFASNGIQLSENSTRVRWTDSSAGTLEIKQSGTVSGTYVVGQVGNTWRMDANERYSGEANLFKIYMLSLDSLPVLSDGTAPDYDCSTSIPGVVSRELPPGEQAENQYCQLLTAQIQGHGLSLGTGSGGGVALGGDAALADGTVSLGSPAVLRRLANVADALDEVDVLIMGQLDTNLLAAEMLRAEKLSGLLDVLEKEVASLEALASAAGGSDSDSDSDAGIGAAWGLLLLMLVTSLGRRAAVSQ